MKARKFSMLAVMAGAILVSNVASAQSSGKRNVFGFMGASPRISKTAPIGISPKRWARVDRFGNIVGPWVNIVTDNDWTGGPWSTVFDCAEISPVTGPAPNGAPWENPAYGPVYIPAQPGARYYFGGAYVNMFTTNDMEVNPLYNGFYANRLALGWYWNPVGGPGTENCTIVINNAELFADTAAGLPPPSGPNNISWGGAFDGVALDFGSLTTQPVGGAFYFANVNLDVATPIDMDLPLDGKGAYVITLRNGPTTLASRGQMMLWMTKQTNYGLPGGNPSKQGDFQWDDDGGTAGPNVSDAIHQTDPPGPTTAVEFYTYAGAVPTIPEPLGSMYSLYSNFGAFTASSLSDYAVTAGTMLAGNATSLRVAGDNNAVVVLCDEFDANGALELTVDTAATTTSAISVIGTTKSSRADISEFLQLWDNNTNSWTQIAFNSGMAPTYFTTRGDVTVNAANFITAAGVVKARYFWSPQLDFEAGDGWTMTCDRMTIFVKGTAN